MISGDVNMLDVPHERLALQQHGFVTVFFERRWNGWDFYQKSALLLYWWPVVIAKVVEAKSGSFWAIPAHWRERKDGELREIEPEDGIVTMPTVAHRATEPERKVAPRRRRPKKRQAGQANFEFIPEDGNAEAEKS